ncbi:MAG: transporter substrate-binding domain-containing protein, partial [Clostridia bacterium]|nr:transporter substrate-binding domain-containing protein [Clostridia bacterium]
MVRLKRIIGILLFCVLLCVLLTGCNSDNEKNYQSIEDFSNSQIGVLTGSSHESLARTTFPDADLVFFNSTTDMLISLEQGKIDCFLYEAPSLQAMLWDGADVGRVDEPLTQIANGFAFPQNEEIRHLQEEFNTFLQQAKTDGSIDQLKQKWLSNTEPTIHPDYKSLPGENGTIRLVVCSGSKPLIYRFEDQYTGFEIDLLTLFGQQYGYNFIIDDVSFNAVIAGIISGKYDMAAAALNITPEREESIDFSLPYSEFDIVLIIKNNIHPVIGCEVYVAPR